MVNDLLDRMIDLARECLGLFAQGTIHLSAGGSAFYDVVATRLGGGNPFPVKHTVLRRSGCYITHNSVMYAKTIEALRD